MNTFFKENNTLFAYLLPTALLCLYVLISSYSSPLHDFSNSYFSAKLLHDSVPPETVIFDIYDFNTYIWNLGYTDVLVDFYVNSPFTLSAFYPLAYVDNPYIAKFVFNGVSILLFLIGLFLLAKKNVHEHRWLLLLVPIIFYVPIKNQILFGQSYFIVFFFVVTGIYFLDKNKEYLTGAFLGFAVLLKFFPVFYGVQFLFQKKWKAILWCIIATLVLCIIGMLLTGTSLWKSYFFDILPHTFLSNTTTDFRPNYQSLDVFFKTLFVYDAYYNPDALLANDRLYVFANWCSKALIIGSAIAISIQKKRDSFTLLAIWITALFLTQGRTATYAQILWVVPLFVMVRNSISLKHLLLLIGLFACISNIPFHKLLTMPIGVQFSRLWLVIFASVLIYRWIGGGLNLKYITLVFIVLTPLFSGVFKSETLDKSQYVLSEKKHFIVYDFFNNNGKLAYKVLGKNGDETITTGIKINSFDTQSIVLKDHQLYKDNRVLTSNISLKKKPVLVNNSHVYFLTDHRSRRGAFTLKSITIKN